MSDVGLFTVHRAVFDHPVFPPEPFTEMQAWFWLLSSAAWKDTRVRVGATVYELKRGELVFATRFLATRWKWSHSHVVRFLNKLKIETMVDTQPTHDATRITICNYNEYQFGGNADETQNETQTGTTAERARNKEEEDNKLRSNNRGADAPKVVSITPSSEKLFFDQAVLILGESGRSFAAKLLKAKDRNFTAAHRALLDAAQKTNPKEYLGAIIRGDVEDEEERMRRRSF